jgi:hypothetical protein
MKGFFVDDGDDDLTLVCPVCGGTGLHQERVDVVCREDEDGPPKTVSVSSNGAVHTVNGAGGGRRQSVSVVFIGECGHTSRLDMTQHKGMTLVVFDPVRPTAS